VGAETRSRPALGRVACTVYAHPPDPTIRGRELSTAGPVVHRLAVTVPRAAAASGTLPAMRTLLATLLSAVPAAVLSAVPAPPAPPPTPAASFASPASPVGPSASPVAPPAPLVGPSASPVGPSASPVAPPAPLVGPSASPVGPSASPVAPPAPPIAPVAPVAPSVASHAGSAEPAPGGAVPRGEFGWPLPGVPNVVRPFDQPEHPYGPGHRGVDLGGGNGQQVLAAGAGIVAFAGLVAGTPVISVDHPNGLRTTYEPAVAVVVAGQPVARGQQIGVLLAGHHPDCQPAACLHWGVRRGQEYLDPLWLLAPGRVRLLPAP